MTGEPTAGEPMSDELLSLRAIVVSSSREHRDLVEQALSTAAVPIDVVAAEGAAAAKDGLAGGADLLYIDADLAPPEVTSIIAAARAARSRPFSVLLSVDERRGEPFAADALAGKPERPEDARRLIDRSIRARLPSRVLVVDDSATMRGIVRKLLAGTGFPFEVSEADEGFAALKTVRETAIDLVFLDYNMPGFSGLETIAEFKREKQRVHVVLMTSADDESLPDRAREQGAAFLKKPFYPADIDAALCRFYGLRALNPERR
jgi:CheY-like chemotaxis protein